MIHWTPNQLRFCLKEVLLSPDEFTMVKWKKSYLLFYKSGAKPLPQPPRFRNL